MFLIASVCLFCFPHNFPHERFLSGIHLHASLPSPPLPYPKPISTFIHLLLVLPPSARSVILVYLFVWVLCLATSRLLSFTFLLLLSSIVVVFFTDLVVYIVLTFDAVYIQTHTYTYVLICVCMYTHIHTYINI